MKKQLFLLLNLILLIVLSSIGQNKPFGLPVSAIALHMASNPTRQGNNA